VFFKLMLVSRLEKLVSDRRLLEYCSLRLDILYFMGYKVDEDLTWHSIISSTRQLYPAAIFEYLFDHVFVQCVAAGLGLPVGTGLDDYLPTVAQLAGLSHIALISKGWTAKPSSRSSVCHTPPSCRPPYREQLQPLHGHRRNRASRNLPQNSSESD
jgi:hypothetical protein